METWKHLEGRWWVSDKGRVKSVWDKRPDRILSQYLVNGYPSCSSAKSKGHTKMVHRMVLEAFVGPCPKDWGCHHKDNNRQNNNLENLEWVPQKKNAEESWDMRKLVSENRSLKEENERLKKLFLKEVFNGGTKCSG